MAMSTELLSITSAGLSEVFRAGGRGGFLVGGFDCAVGDALVAHAYERCGAHHVPGRSLVVVHVQSEQRPVVELRAPRGHDPSAGAGLLDPGVRHGVAGSRGDEPVVGRFVRVSVRAVAGNHGDVVESGDGQRPSGLFGDLGIDLDRDHSIRFEAVRQCNVAPGARADLQRSIATVDFRGT